MFRQIAKGDEVAYTRIFHLFTPRLFPYILKITKDETLAKEFLQETFLRLWVNRDDLAHINNPASWLFKIAANICLNHLRSEAIHNKLQAKVYEKMKPGEYPVAEIAEGREMELMISKAVDTLSPQRKEVYLLSRHEGLSHKEIADKLGISINTVKNHIGTALKGIQEYLHEKTGLSIAVLSLILAI